MKRWIGRSLFGIGLVHTVFGLVGFSAIWARLLGEGLVNTVNRQPMREAAFWFLFSGFLLLLLGALIDWCESQGLALPRFLGWSLLVLTLVSAAVMPVSGIWLALIPTLGALRRPAMAAAR